MSDLPWRGVCSAILEQELSRAADILASIGERSLQAEVRLLAARSLAAAGRLAEAERELGLARAFWQGVGATAYLREADGVIAAVG